MVLRQITDEVMYTIRDLTGQEYVDTYATKYHESMPSAPAVISPQPPEERAPEVKVAEGSNEPRSSASVLRQDRPLVDLVTFG
jgi:hypothetical protein